MLTPAGYECKHYYEDYYRGRDVQECRLIAHEDSLPWHPSDCAKCPVPAILDANASSNLELTLTIKPRFFSIGRKHVVTAFCVKHKIPVEDAYIGCEKCNEERPGLDLFRQALEQSDEPDDD